MTMSMEELLLHFQHQPSSSIHLSSNSTINCSMSHAFAATTLSDVSAPPSPSPSYLDSKGQLFMVGNATPQISSRPRLATWTFSPDSGYADSVASPATSSPPGFGASCKKRFSASLDDISDQTSASSKIPECIAEKEPSDLESSSFSLDFSQEYPSRIGSTELVVLRQPEAQHRPRYETEGSRGRIKDRCGSSCPAVQLKNFHGRSAVLQVFVAMERGLVKPHPLFRICKVNSKRTAPAIVRTLAEDNLTILEMPFSEMNDWTIDVDCASLVKLRNADCEVTLKKSSEFSDISKRQKRTGCPKVRLGFRAVLTMLGGSTQILQTTSSPISCSTTLGVPEVHFVSHRSCPVSGGLELVVIGRGFVRNESHLFVIEKDQDDVTVWDAELDIAWDKFNQVHLVGTMPAYRDLSVTKPAVVYLYVGNNDGKKSDLHSLTYTRIDNSHVTNTEHTEAAVEGPEQSSPAQPSQSRANIKIDSHPEQPILPAPLSPDSAQPVLITTQPPVGVVAKDNIHYLIQLPGSLQPIIITVPQPNGVNATLVPVTQDSPPFAVAVATSPLEAAHKAPRLSLTADNDACPVFGQLSVDLRGVAPHVLESPVSTAKLPEEDTYIVAQRSNYMNLTVSSSPLEPNGRLADDQNYEKGAQQFDELLKEILGFDILSGYSAHVTPDFQQQQQQEYHSCDMDLSNAEAWLLDMERESAVNMMDYESSFQH